MADVRAARRAGERERQRELAFGQRRGVRIALAGAVAVVIATVTAVVLSSGGASGARVIRALVTPPGASALVRVDRGRGQLIVQRMPAPPAGDIYQVWLKRSTGGPVPTSALFGVTSTGAADVAVPGDLKDVRAVLVTPERSGGSLFPTHKPVIIAKLA
jgi:anti-sigma-K factor RskA